MKDWIVPIIVAFIMSLPGLVSWLKGLRKDKADVATTYEAMASKQAGEISDLRIKVNQIKDENDTLLDKVRAVENENEKLMAEIGALKSEKDELSGKVDELTCRLDEYDDGIRILISQLDENQLTPRWKPKGR